MERLGRYELVARLAQGGMGEIFLARLEGAAGFSKLYAIKRILPQFASDGRFRKMLIGEATIASKMAHSNICQVHELGESDGQLYIVMEYLEGVTLLPLLRACSKRSRPLELGFVASVLSQICDALHYAHELKDRDGQSLDVIHRDVTLANVFVCESGTAKVLDFGIARVKDTQGTQTGTVKGKYAYMAPEQLRGEAISRRVDVFALGVVAFEMLALRRLFQRQTDYLTFHAVLEAPIADLRRYRSDLPIALVATIMKALDRDPEKRFPTVRALGSALADAIGRPWPQEEVGNLVKELFADDIGARQAAVAAAIAKGGSLDGPPIASNAADDEDDEQGFPPVDTQAGPISGDIQTVIERIAQRQQSDTAPGALPRVELGPVGSSLDAGAVPGSPDLAPLPPAKQGSRVWLWVALVLVLLAGGGVAVAFVMQEKQTIVIEQEDVTPMPTREEDEAVVKERVVELTACVRKYPVTASNVLLGLVIDAEGHAEKVTFEPDEIDRAGLGDCLRKVLTQLKFKARKHSTGRPIDLKLKDTPRK